MPVTAVQDPPSARPPGTILHLECGTSFGGSARCLENFLRHRTSRDCRHLVGLYMAIPGRERLAACADGLEVFPGPAPGAGRSVSEKLSRIAGQLRLAARLFHFLRREKVNLVRLNNSPPPHWAAVLAARAARIPCVAWLRSFPTEKENVPLWHWVSARVQAFAAVSEAVRQAHIALGLPGEKITVLYEGTEIPPLPARSAGDASPRRPFRVGSLGRLVAIKGLLDLVRAAQIVSARHAEVCFEIAGEEDPYAPGFGTELRDETERLGLSDKVQFPGFIADTRSFLLSLDCLVNPSVVPEGLPMAVLEAMALGCPVVATASGGTVEAVESGVSGLLVPPGDPEALAGALLELIDHPQRRRELGQAARHRAEQLFELRHQCFLQEDFLARSLLTRGPP